MASRFRRVMPGLLTATDAAAINHIAEIVESLATREMTATFGLVASVPGHLSPGSAIPSHPDTGLGFWARVTGTDVDGRHAWQEVWPDIGVDGILVWRDSSRSSSLAQTPAYKADGGTAAVGTRVWLQFAPGRHRFLFGATGSALTVAALDGDPSFPGIHTLLFDEADGFIVDSPSPGVVRIDIGQASEFRLPTSPPTGPSLTTPGFIWLDPTSGLVTFIRPDGSEAELVNMPLPEIDGGPGPYKVWWTAPPEGTAEWKGDPAILAIGLRGANEQEIYLRAANPEAGGWKMNLPNPVPGTTWQFIAFSGSTDLDGYSNFQWGGIYTGTDPGLVPDGAPSNTTDFLRRDGVWAVPPGGGGGGGTFRWEAIEVAFDDFGATYDEFDSDSSRRLLIYTLAAFEVLHDVIVKHSVAFSGGTITDVLFGVGADMPGLVGGDYFVQNFEVDLAPSDTSLAQYNSTGTTSTTGSVKQSFAAGAGKVLAKLDTVGGPIALLEAGTVTVWLLISDLTTGSTLTTEIDGGNF